MNVCPVNRMILVDPVEEEKDQQESTVLLPDDYRPVSPYGVGKVVVAAKDCKLDLNDNDKIVFENSMLQEVSVLGQKNYLLLENYVLCILEGSTDEP